MKKIFVVLFLFLSLFLVACNDEDLTGNEDGYQIVFKLDDGTTIISFRAELDSEMMYPANPDKDGFTFVGWTLNGAPFTGDKVTGNMELVAEFADVVIVVTFYNGNLELGTALVPYNGKVAGKEPSTDKENYEFNGWFLNQSLTTPFDSNATLTENINVYGKWTSTLPISYQVRFFDGSTILATYEVQENATLQSNQIPSTTKSGYTFDGWFLNSSFTTSFNTSSAITQDLDIYGKWTMDTPGFEPGNYTGYYASLNGLSQSAMKSQLTSMIKSIGSATGSTSQVQNADKWQGKTYNIYTGLGSYGNREHVVPASKLRESNAPEYDLHNLRAAVVSVNSTRSNYPFGPGTGTQWKLTSGKFYPGSEHVRDVARIVLYVTTRYNVPISKVGDLQMFLEWHQQDPVDDFEITRNGRIYDVQKSRNPFIDHPELVYVMFGSTSTSTYSNEMPAVDLSIPTVYTFTTINTYRA